MKIHVLCFVALAFAAPASAQMVPLTVQGPYLQPASGMTYPESAGEFRRVSVMQYKPDGSDISAGYLRAQPGAEIVATAYSFPTPPPATDTGLSADQAKARMCGAVAGSVVKSIQTSYPTAALTRTNLTTLDQMGGTQNGYHAVLNMTVPKFMGRDQEAVKSEAFVFCNAGGKWTMEYRFTYPATTPDSGPAIAKFMDDLKWTFTQ